MVDIQKQIKRGNKTMKVELVDKMGTDLSVSMPKSSYAKYKDSFEDKDEKLIKFLAEHNHWSSLSASHNLELKHLFCKAISKTSGRSCME